MHTGHSRPGQGRCPPPAWLLFLLAGWNPHALAEPGSWCELVTPRFHLVSDLPEQAQRQLVARLERFETVAEPYLPGSPVRYPASLKIVVFSERAEFTRLTGKRKFAGFMQPSLSTNRLLVGPIRGSLTETALHEYAHYLMRNRLEVSLPLWFDEGLASLLGVTEIHDDHALLGRLPASRMSGLTQRDFQKEPPLRGLTRSIEATDVADWSQNRIDAFYDWSWLLVHYLYFSSDGHFGSVVGEVALNDRRAWLDAFLAAREVPIIEYLNLSGQRLVRALDRHLRRGAGTRRLPLPPSVPVSASFTCLDPFPRDLELARAVLVQNPAQARALLASHEAGHGDDVGLLVTRARIALAEEEVEEAARLAHLARALAPDSAATLILAADIQVRDCLFTRDEACLAGWREATDLYRSALEQDRERFDAVLGLGLAYLYTGRPGEAINYLRVAYARAPWAPMANYYLGEAYRLIGDRRAAGYLVNARNWAVLPVWRSLADESLRLMGAAPSENRSDL